MSIRFYENNPKLLSANSTIEFTKDQIYEISKCKKDIFYFIKNYAKITSVEATIIPFEPRDFQTDIIKTITEERFLILLSGRQTGKTTTFAVYLLWKILFNSNTSVLITSYKEKYAKDFLSRIKNMFENIPLWMQSGITKWNVTEIELENKSKISAESTTETTGTGGSYSIIVSDELAKVSKRIADSFMKSVFPTISSGTSTKFFICSTPLGYNHFYRIFDDAKKGKNRFIAKEANWRAVVGRDEKWVQEQIEILGEDGFAQEHECKFIGNVSSLLDVYTHEKIVPKTPVSIDGNLKIYEHPVNLVETFTKKTQAVQEVIRATPIGDFTTYDLMFKKNKIPERVIEKAEEEQYNPGYVLIVDVSEGVGGDNSAISVVKIHNGKYEQVATFKDNKIAPSLFAIKIMEISKYYNDAFALVENNSIGSQLLHILIKEHFFTNLFYTSKKGAKTVLEMYGGDEVKAGIRTTQPVKNLGCNLLKTLIRNDSLLVYDQDTYEEFTNFSSNGKTYCAASGYTDDLVMTLVLFAWLTAQPVFMEYQKEVGKTKLRRNFGSNSVVNISKIYSEVYGDDDDEGFVDRDGVWEVIGKIPFR
jgi:hypothetical protein